MKCEHEWKIEDQFTEEILFCVCELCGDEQHFGLCNEYPLHKLP